MTLYARSDVLSVALSRDHGGCGASHSRPVTHGSPTKVWALTCAPCEDHLRRDPHWSTNAEEIPETPDEQKLRELQEKRGEKNIAAGLETSIASLASSQEGMQKLMTIMTAALAGSNPAVADALASLTGGAAKATESVNKLAAAVDEMGAGNEDEEPLEDVLPDVIDVPDLSKLTVKDLRALARDRGVADTGNRAQLLERLTQAS